MNSQNHDTSPVEKMNDLKTLISDLQSALSGSNRGNSKVTTQKVFSSQKDESVIDAGSDASIFLDQFQGSDLNIGLTKQFQSFFKSLKYLKDMVLVDDDDVGHKRSNIVSKSDGQDKPDTSAGNFFDAQSSL